MPLMRLPRFLERPVHLFTYSVEGLLLISFNYVFEFKWRKANTISFEKFVLELNLWKYTLF